MVITLGNHTCAPVRLPKSFNVGKYIVDSKTMLTLFPLQNQRMAHRTTIAEAVIMEVRLFLFSTGRFDFLELKHDIVSPKS